MTPSLETRQEKENYRTGLEPNSVECLTGLTWVEIQSRRVETDIGIAFH